MNTHESFQSEEIMLSISQFSEVIKEPDFKIMLIINEFKLDIKKDVKGKYIFSQEDVIKFKDIIELQEAHIDHSEIVSFINIKYITKTKSFLYPFQYIHAIQNNDKTILEETTELDTQKPVTKESFQKYFGDWFYKLEQQQLRSHNETLEKTNQIIEENQKLKEELQNIRQEMDKVKIQIESSSETVSNSLNALAHQSEKLNNINEDTNDKMKQFIIEQREKLTHKPKEKTFVEKIPVIGQFFSKNE